MKRMNLHNQKHNFWIKGLSILSLSLPLQASTSGACSRTVLEHKAKESVEQWRQNMENTKDISRDEGGLILYVAVEAKDSNKVKEVLERIHQDNQSGAAANYKHDFPHSIGLNSKRTAFGRSLELGNAEIVRDLLNCPYIDLNKVGNNATALLIALKNNKEEIAQILLNECPETKTLDITSKDPKTGFTPLHLAIEKGFDKVTKALVHKLQSIDSLCASDIKSRTPLHMAVRSNRQFAFQYVFDRIAKLSSKAVAIEKLFAKNKDGISVFARAYLPRPIAWRNILKSGIDDIEMFTYVLRMVRDNLTPSQWDAITDEMLTLDYRGKFDVGDIDILRDIVAREKGK
ncbi:ankyrin repeat domain-containing protein [Candidatus Cardinium hertigii]|nr:ankyrin repeat domain-containing protein [Candidatus Cardinium hertigii]